MAKLYWATNQHAEYWSPCEDREDAIRQARDWGLWGIGVEGDVRVIWVAPADAAKDDEDRFWLRLAELFLGEYEGVDNRLAEEGWIDHDESWLTGFEQDRNGDLARALRATLPARPAWRKVDEKRAVRVELVGDAMSAWGGVMGEEIEALKELVNLVKSFSDDAEFLLRKLGER